jgi:glutaredoxin-related protein
VCEEHSYEALVDVINEVRESLEEFDLNWVTYEQLYVIELMLIE